MAGLGSRFVDAGFVTPKPFIDVLGEPMIMRVLENLKYPNARYLLLIRSEHMEQEKLAIDRIKDKYNVTFVPVSKVTEGTASTVLLAENYIDNKTPLVVANSDQIVDVCFSDFVDDCFHRKLDGSILTFKDESRDPKWSFARIDSDGFVLEVREKVAISEYATVGIYMYNKGSDFVDKARLMICNNDRVNGEFYTCPVYNYIIDNNQKVGIYNILESEMHGLGTPLDLQAYIDLHNNKSLSSQDL